MQIDRLANASDDEIKALQNKSYEILCYFDSFCRKYDMKYSLGKDMLMRMKIIMKEW